MTALDPARLQRTTREIAAELASDHALAAEIARARREFAGGTEPAGDLDAAAEGRFCEWFAIERESDVLGDVPVRVVGGVPHEVREALLDSVCGIFLVEGGSDDPRARDIITEDELTLAPDDRIETGDLLIGRLYPTPDGLVTPSPLVARVRNGAELAAALRLDLRQVDLDRRLSQAEIETVLRLSEAPAHASTDSSEAEPGETPEEVEARLEALLGDIEDGELSAHEISAALASSPEGPGAVVGPLLEEYAFASDVDLGVLQRTLIDLWNAHRAQRPKARPQARRRRSTDGEDLAGPGLGAAIARRLEEGAANNEDIDTLFGDVESMLGEQIEEDDDDDAGPRQDGDLEPLVAEFLWERDHRQGSAAETVLTAFVAQQQGLPIPGVYLDAITPNELARFLLQTYLAAPPGHRAARVSAYFAVLSEFFAWGEETQEYALAGAIETCRREVAEPLARTARASLALSTATEVVGSLRPQVHRVQRIEAGEVEVAGDHTPPLWLDLPAAASLLRVGDIILAGLTADGQGGASIDGLAVVLPAGATELIE